MKDIVVSARLRRVNPDHVLNLFEGEDDDGRPCLVLFSGNTPTSADFSRLKSSRSIDVKLRQRTDGLYALSFSLIDPNMKDLFDSFIKDMVLSSEGIPTDKTGLSFISRRYSAWRNLFNKTEVCKLSFKEIKGLIGELLFMKYYMFAEYGFEKAVKAWVGPDGADQDYRIDNTWFEIKTTTSGNTAIEISSLEQLDCPGSGFLVVMKLDVSSIADSNSITLNSVIEEMRSILSIYGCEEFFDTKLVQSGYYYQEEYNQICFSYNGMFRFVVDDDFPVLRRKDIRHNEIINATYFIETNNLKDVGGELS